MNLEVVYTAAHAHFPDTEPLGGGKAVADYLIRHHPDWSVLSPQSVGLSVAQPLTEMSEFAYARFCRQFERATTNESLKRDPQRCVVLCNDISEGPNFSVLDERGYAVVTIFHVDVVEFFCKMYLKDFVPSHWLSKLRLFSAMPDVLRLVFEKQHDCVRHSARIVVPSEPMWASILRCYPWCDPQKIVVLPWGNIAEHDAILPGDAPYSIADDEFVIMTLSRLSPEKGIERLLAALPHVETHGRKLRVFICGAPAFMKGRRYERRLRRMASRVTNVCVEFTGHVTGRQKTALLRRADLFVSPSRHESYGLTIAEAQAAGCRIISHSHYGAAGTVVDCARPRKLAQAISSAASCGPTVKTHAEECTCDKAQETSRKLAELLLDVAKGRWNHHQAGSVAPFAAPEKH
ncbi:MAG TPA: glycosyltransferase family 4 protein [Verrucomicrobiae bacterium]|nr:glycosyltransferase family 4 protein [Verrucomicrobiae bacterium]